MISLYAAIVTVAGLAAVSVIFAVFNWFFLRRLSGTISLLEEEVEKKTTEFNIIRKERQNASMQTYPPSANTGTSEYTAPLSGEIQVIRNVREGYETDTGSYMEGAVMEMGGAHPVAAASSAQPYSETPQSMDFSASSAHNPAVPGAGVERYSQQEPLNTGTDENATTESAYDAARGKNPYSIPNDQESSSLPPVPLSEGADIMEVVGEQPSDSFQPDNCIRIPVYSDQKKDADFQFVSLQLKNEFPRYKNPAIILDFSRVNFIYEKEIEYLEKLYGYAAGRNLPILFVNCEADLITKLGNFPALLACVRG